MGPIITSTSYTEREMKRTLETDKNSSSRESSKPRRVIDTSLFKKVEISYGKEASRENTLSELHENRCWREWNKCSITWIMDEDLDDDSKEKCLIEKKLKDVLNKKA